MRTTSHKNDFSSRIKELIGDSSLNSFAKKVGIGEGSIRQYTTGGLPRIDVAIKIAEICKVDLTWLLTGNGPQRKASSDIDTLSDGLSLIPRFEVEAAAGQGAYVENEESIGEIAFNTKWLKHQGLEPAKLNVITATGDSMEPTIRDGSILLVDTRVSRVVDERPYVISRDGLLLVKRVQLGPEKGVTLVSDNPIFEKQIIANPEEDNFRILGRVVWSGRNM